VKYRIITSGNGFYAQCKYKYWPFWMSVFDVGRNYFTTLEKAESAIKRVIEYAQTDGRVVKVILVDTEVKG
jgi:hypothetical protein